MYRIWNSNHDFHLVVAHDTVDVNNKTSAVLLAKSKLFSLGHITRSAATQCEGHQLE